MQPKKMTLVQLTFIVAVNMMLPTNMAQVGAISLLSWLVTAIGSMAIAYGFAQAGLFNQREGGMSAYAEVVTSPATCTSPVVTRVSTATREVGSWAISASRTESLI